MDGEKFREEGHVFYQKQDSNGKRIGVIRKRERLKEIIKRNVSQWIAR